MVEKAGDGESSLSIDLECMLTYGVIRLFLVVRAI